MKTWDQYNKNIRDLSEKKVDQDSDGDNDFRDVRIARMIASGVPKEVAIQKTEGKPYDEKGSKKKKFDEQVELVEKKNKKDLRDTAKEILADIQTGKTAEERAKEASEKEKEKEERRQARARQEAERLELAKQSLELRRKKQEDDQKEREAKREERARSEESKKQSAKQKREDKQKEAEERSKNARKKAIRKSEEAKTKRLEGKVKEKSSAVKDRMAKAKSAMPSDLEQISDTEGDATAVGKMGANIAKTAVGTVGATYQLGRAAYEKMRERKYKKQLGKREPEKGTTKQRLKYKVRGAALAGARKIGYTEEFLYEVDDAPKKDKIKKIVDIMKGKNKIEINPQIKEKYNHENWKDNFKPNDYESIDLIKPDPLKPSKGIGSEMLDEAGKKCWKGYKKVGTQKLFGKTYNRCVKEDACPVCGYDPCQCLEGTINEIHSQAHTPHEVPSKDLKKLVKKAVKRIDYDVDGDVDPQDKVEKSKGEYGEELPTPFGKFRTGGSEKVKTKKESFSNWRSEIEEGAAWTKKSGKNPKGGLNEKGRKSYERENPGSDLKAPSKKVGNPRRASFCARMKGMKKKLTSSKTANDPNSRINKSLRAWNC